MVVVDRWLVVGLLGIAIMVLSAAGEFLFGWWDDLGAWAFWSGLGLGIVGLVTNASREQAKELKALLVRLLASNERIEANTAGIPRIEANTAGIPRIEANTQRIEANTQRIEANTEGIVPLLREIRDRLPPPAQP